MAGFTVDSFLLIDLTVERLSKQQLVPINPASINLSHKTATEKSLGLEMAAYFIVCCIVR
jgi:hypothetical protein